MFWLWNTLPADVTSSPSLTTFKRWLKTVLFARSFPNSSVCVWHFVYCHLRCSRVLSVFSVFEGVLAVVDIAPPQSVCSINTQQHQIAASTINNTTNVVWCPRVCNRHVLSLCYITSFCRLLSISDNNLFRDVSVVVQRRSWHVDYVHSLSHFSAVDVFYSNGFHCEVDWSVGLCPDGYAGVYVGRPAHLL